MPGCFIDDPQERPHRSLRSAVQQGPNGAVRLRHRRPTRHGRDAAPSPSHRSARAQALIDSRPRGPTRRSWLTASTGCSRGRALCSCCTARPRRRSRTAERRAEGHPMNISAALHPPADRDRSLLMVGLLLCGLVAYPLLPVAALPNVNYPTIQISRAVARRRSADHGVHGRHAARAAAQPDSRRHPADLVERTRRHHDSPCSSSCRAPIDSAAVDVLAAINAASPFLPPTSRIRRRSGR